MQVHWGEPRGPVAEHRQSHVVLISRNAYVQIVKGPQPSFGIQASDGWTLHQHGLYAAGPETCHHACEAASVEGGLDTVSIIYGSKLNSGRGHPEDRVPHAPPAPGPNL